MVLADFGTGQVFWSMFWFFLFFIWIMILFRVFGDIFVSRDLSGGAKAMWCVFVILLPYLGVLIYLIANHDGMADRNLAQVQQQKAATDEYIRSVSGGAAGEIERAKGLLDSGAITQSEFDSIKAKALAAS